MVRHATVQSHADTGDAPGAAPSFVLLGHHRGGTSFVTSLCKAHPEVECINEPFSMHCHCFRLNEAERWEADELDPVVWHASLNGEPGDQRFVADLRAWMRAPMRGLQRGFKETHLMLKLPWLGALLGPVAGAGIARDPRAVAGSVLRRSMHRSWWNYEVLAEEYAIRGEFARSGVPEPDVSDVRQVIGALWGLRMRAVVDFMAARGLPVIRLEDLVRYPLPTLTVLMRQGLGTEPSESQASLIARSHERSDDHTYSFFRDPSRVFEGWRDTLHEEDAVVVVQATGTVAEELRYA